MIVRVTKREFKVFIRGKLYKICNTKQEAESVMAALKKDRNLKDSDVSLGLSFLVST